MSDIVSYDEMKEDFREKRFEFFKNMCEYVDCEMYDHAIEEWNGIKIWLCWLKERKARDDSK